MSVQQTPEQKKEEFRKYLERSGVIDQLTKVLVGLYEEPEKPSDSVAFIKKCLGAPSDTDIDVLRADNDDLKSQHADLQRKIDTLQSEIEAEKAKLQWEKLVQRMRLQYFLMEFTIYTKQTIVSYNPSFIRLFLND